jgi:hypothetical protein
MQGMQLPPPYFDGMPTGCECHVQTVNMRDHVQPSPTARTSHRIACASQSLVGTHPETTSRAFVQHAVHETHPVGVAIGLQDLWA